MKKLFLIACVLILSGCEKASYKSGYILQCFSGGKLIFEHEGAARVSVEGNGLTGIIFDSRGKNPKIFQSNASCISIMKR